MSIAYPQGPALAATQASGLDPSSVIGNLLSPAPLACLVDIERCYTLGGAPIHALRGVSLNVYAGELLAICGPSGSGKSTLLNMLGLVDTPDRGEVIFQHRNLRDLNDCARARLRNRSIGFIFQNFNLIPVLNALENVLLPLQLRGRIDAATRKAATDLLDEVGLSAHLRAKPDQMSGGQRQRVAIARAMVTHPQLVVADEPTANLDTDNSLNIMNLINRISRERGVAFVFSTHDGRVLEHVDRRVWLQDGLIIDEEN